MIPSGFRALPTPLRSLRRYLPWRARRRENGSVGKVPCAAMEERDRLCPVDPLRSEHWVTLQQATMYWEGGHADGIGLAVDEALGWSALDIDHCIHVRGELSPLATSILDAFPETYVERSPSGEGLHLLIPGRWPSGWRRQSGLEIIDCGYVTVTGQVIRPATVPGVNRAALAEWHARHAPPRPAPPSPVSRLAFTPTLEEVLRRARNAANAQRFEALWAGELAGLPSASEGDLTLLLMLLYWAGDQISDDELDGMFRASGRLRSRWFLPETGLTYGRRTIQRARQIRARG